MMRCAFKSCQAAFAPRWPLCDGRRNIHRISALLTPLPTYSVPKNFFAEAAKKHKDYQQVCNLYKKM
jgi:hypothetical protein